MYNNTRKNIDTNSKYYSRKIIKKNTRRKSRRKSLMYDNLYYIQYGSAVEPKKPKGKDKKGTKGTKTPPIPPPTPKGRESRYSLPEIQQKTQALEVLKRTHAEAASEHTKAQQTYAEKRKTLQANVEIVTKKAIQSGQSPDIGHLQKRQTAMNAAHTKKLTEILSKAGLVHSGDPLKVTAENIAAHAKKQIAEHNASTGIDKALKSKQFAETQKEKREQGFEGAKAKLKKAEENLSNYMQKNLGQIDQNKVDILTEQIAKSQSNLESQKRALEMAETTLKDASDDYRLIHESTSLGQEQKLAAEQKLQNDLKMAADRIKQRQFEERRAKEEAEREKKRVKREKSNAKDQAFQIKEIARQMESKQRKRDIAENLLRAFGDNKKILADFYKADKDFKELEEQSKILKATYFLNKDKRKEQVEYLTKLKNGKYTSKKNLPFLAITEAQKQKRTRIEAARRADQEKYKLMIANTTPSFDPSTGEFIPAKVVNSETSELQSKKHSLVLRQMLSSRKQTEYKSKTGTNEIRLNEEGIKNSKVEYRIKEALNLMGNPGNPGSSPNPSSSGLPNPSSSGLPNPSSSGLPIPVDPSQGPSSGTPNPVYPSPGPSSGTPKPNPTPAPTPGPSQPAPTPNPAEDSIKNNKINTKSRAEQIESNIKQRDDQILEDLKNPELQLKNKQAELERAKAERQNLFNQQSLIPRDKIQEIFNEANSKIIRIQKQVIHQEKQLKNQTQKRERQESETSTKQTKRQSNEVKGLETQEQLITKLKETLPNAKSLKGIQSNINVAGESKLQAETLSQQLKEEIPKLQEQFTKAETEFNLIKENVNTEKGVIQGQIDKLQKEFETIDPNTRDVQKQVKAQQLKQKIIGLMETKSNIDNSLEQAKTTLKDQKKVLSNAKQNKKMQRRI